MRHRPLTLAAAPLAVLAALGVHAGLEPSGHAEAPPPGEPARLHDNGIHVDLSPTELRVMTFNVWLGGTVVDINQVAAAIRASGADVVGLQESDGNARRIAELVGWPHADERLQIISRFPLMSPPEGEDDYTYVQLAPGQVVAMANIHLPSDPYGPYLVRDGEVLDDVIVNEEDTRMWRVDELTPGWQRAIDAGIPLLLTGDFNAPSHRDWTDAAVGARSHVRYAVDWPVSDAVEALGFVDTYRTAHPDPVADPGITWTFGYPYPRIDADEAADRIDFVYASGADEVLGSEIVGPSGAGDVSIEIDPYPSDHLGVVSTVLVEPVAPPPFVAVASVRTEVGQPLGVHYHAPAGEDTDRIVLVPSGGDPQTDGFASLPPAEADYFGRVNLGTGGQPPGEYDAVLTTDADGDGDGEPVEVSRSRFWLVEPGAVPQVSVVGQPAVGDPITVAWSSTWARKFDWIGVFPADDPDLYAYVAYAYTGATVDGSYTFGPDDLGEAMLPAGDYVVRVMSDDSYVSLAEVPLTIA